MKYCLVAVILAVSTLSGVAQADEDGFKEIFNGKNLDGWRGKSELWSVEDGAITGVTTADAPIPQNTFLIWEGDAANFILELDFKISAEGNSGVQYRSEVKDEKEFVVGGYQADIDPKMVYAGINYEEKGRGILVQRGQRVVIAEDGTKEVEDYADAKELAAKIHSEKWNHYRIVAKGNKLSHYINDELMSEVIDGETKKASQKGVIALQVHKGPPMKVQFKNLKLKVVD